jgi:Asp-tRNA(Asn)/Glu-tRNA(Gln) amidotransferase A subunit family amidase
VALVGTRLAPSSAVERALEVIVEVEPSVHAWAFLDHKWARAEARRVRDDVLAGLTLGVKDIFETAELPTEYGSPIYAGYRPRADAAAVALLREAGAIMLGKTVTTEFAWSTPAQTRNPHRLTHTPGGSSSGSAAGVAAGMIDLAIGTQTAGSVIRPASFCGVFGLKPTFGLVPTAGMKQGAPSLDTVGIFAADLGFLDLARATLTRRPPCSPGAPVVFGLLRTDQWSFADRDCQEIIESTGALLGASERELPDSLVGLADDAPIVQNYEGVTSLAWELAEHRELVSAELRERLEWGAEIRSEHYDDVQRRAAIGRSEAVIEALFGEADVLVTPAAPGEAPEGLATTGDPRFCRLWTLLGFPALNVPGRVGDSGLPIGVQLVARPRAEEALIRAGYELCKRLG